MKQTLLLLITCVVLTAKEIIVPAFVAEGEPIPAGVLVQYGYGSNGYHEQMVDLYPFTIGKSDRFLLYPNIGYMGEHFGKSDTLPEGFNGGYVGFAAGGSIGDNFFWNSYQSVGTFGENYHSLSEGIKYFQISAVGYKWRPHFYGSLGVLVNTRFGTPVAVPLLRIIYSTDSFVFEGTLPLMGSIRWKASDDFHLVTSAKLSYQNFAAENVSKGVDINRAELFLTGERRIKGWLWATVGAGYGGNTAFVQLPETDIGDLEAGFRGRVSIVVRPDRNSGTTEDEPLQE